MRQSDLKLDGNAIAGLLREIFTMEMTNAESTCAGCGKVHAVGRVDGYLNAPGAAVPRRGCVQEPVRIVDGPGHYLPDLSGTPCIGHTGVWGPGREPGALVEL